MLTKRRPGAANKAGGDAIPENSAPYLLRWRRPRRVDKTYIGEATARIGAPHQVRNCVFPRGLTLAGGHRATFANQLRGVDALAESS